MEIYNRGQAGSQRADGRSAGGYQDAAIVEQKLAKLELTVE